MYGPDDFFVSEFGKAVKRGASGGGRKPVEPDDVKATSPVMYMVFGLLSLVMVAIFVAALVLPPLFMHTLIVRGIRSGRPGMLVVGLIVAAFYFLIVFAVGRRLMGRPKPPPDEPAE